MSGVFCLLSCQELHISRGWLVTSHQGPAPAFKAQPYLPLTLGPDLLIQLPITRSCQAGCPLWSVPLVPAVSVLSSVLCFFASLCSTHITQACHEATCVPLLYHEDSSDQLPVSVLLHVRISGQLSSLCSSCTVFLYTRSRKSLERTGKAYTWSPTTFIYFIYHHGGKTYSALCYPVSCRMA
jgi:hypothetical protein